MQLRGQDLPGILYEKHNLMLLLVLLLLLTTIVFVMTVMKL